MQSHPAVDDARAPPIRRSFSFSRFFFFSSLFRLTARVLARSRIQRAATARCALARTQRDSRASSPDDFIAKLNARRAKRVAKRLIETSHGRATYPYVDIRAGRLFSRQLYAVYAAEVPALHTAVLCKYGAYMCTLHTRSRMMKRTPRTPHICITHVRREYNVVLRALRYSDFTPALCLSRQKNITEREVNRRHTYVLH